MNIPYNHQSINCNVIKALEMYKTKDYGNMSAVLRSFSVFVWLQARSEQNKVQLYNVNFFQLTAKHIYSYKASVFI